jgi:hypothetical protein
MTLLARLQRLTAFIQEHPEAARAYDVLYGLKQTEEELTLPMIIELVMRLEAIEWKWRITCQKEKHHTHINPTIRL